MKTKNYVIIGIIIVIVLVVSLGGIYFYSLQKDLPSQTYNDCVKQILKEVQKYKSASEEPIGAIRKDNEGITWKKVSNDNWETDAEKYNVGGSKTSWGNGLIDEQIGGAKYTPESFPQCEKYISTKNIEMTKKFTEIVNQVIQEQSQKGVIISVKEVQVINLVGKVQGSIDLNCQDIDAENENIIIGSIADKLFEEYPDDFFKENERRSWVDVSCSYNAGWRISGGNFGMME